MKFSTYTGSMLIALPLIFGLSGTALADNTIESGNDLFGPIQTTTEAGVTATATSTAPDFIGSWAVTLSNNVTKIRNPALYSFLDGGILHQSENPMVDPMLGNLVFSNAHGAWQYNPDDDSYSIRYYKLVFQADASYRGHEETTGKLSFDKTGRLVGTIKVGNITTAFSGKRITAN